MESSSSSEKLSSDQYPLSSSSILGIFDFERWIELSGSTLESLIFSHTSCIIDFQVLITLVHILWALCKLSLFKDLNISTWPLSFEKSSLLLLVPYESIFLVIPKTSSHGATWDQYYGSPKISIPKSFQRDLRLFVQWLEELSSQIVMAFDVLT